DWLAANGGSLPNSPGCPGPTGNAANDPVMLTFRLRVPTNARSFSFNSFFNSAEFPEYVCTQFNDFYVALVDSGATTNPKDKNLAVYIAPNFTRFPVSVNLSFGTNLFAVCDAGQTGCAGGVLGQASCVSGTALLNGTGLDTNTGGCGSPPNNSDLLGGGTGWLTTAGNVVPGEVMEVRIAIWDTSDHVFDSLLLLDNWIWNLNPASPGTR
ncbi:MAG TPA: choice-of-anchor L domain-containing protein, partial [Polyangiaceae bacterium]|nr:choice-of-anchor L domain-containing protein [Polyangiaceae bacterium]